MDKTITVTRPLLHSRCMNTLRTIYLYLCIVEIFLSPTTFIGQDVVTIQEKVKF